MQLKVLLLSEFTYLNTGYANYYRNLASALTDSGHQVVELASYGDWNNPKHTDYAADCKWQVYLNIPHKSSKELYEEYQEREKVSSDAKFGSWCYEKVLLLEKPDVVIGLRDHWYDKFAVDSPLAKYVTLILSPTVDAMPQKGEWLDTYKNADYLTFYNEWSEKVMGDQYNQKNMIPAISPSASTEFCPLDSNKCRAELGLPLDKKIVLTVMRNQDRKRYPELFRAFANVKKDRILFCHTHHQDRGWDIPSLLNQYKIADRVYFSFICKKCGACFADLLKSNKRCPKCSNQMIICSVNDGVEITKLNTIYNSADIYVQPANSEGFGIPMLEAAATGKKVISINYSAMSDIVPKLGGVCLKPKELVRDLFSLCYRAIPDVDSITSILNEDDLYNYDRAEVLEKYNENFSWAKTCKKWVDLISSIRPKNLWAIQPDIKNPVKFEEIKDLNTADFVKYCITHVLCDEAELGSYLHATTLEHLETGHFIPTSAEKGQKANFMLGVSREDVYNKFATMRELKNFWESERVKSL